MSEADELWNHLRKVGIIPCDSTSTIEFDLSDHPVVVRSFSFNCISMDGIIFRDVHATVNVHGVTEITFTSFDSPGHMDLDNALLHLDAMESTLREGLRTFTENDSELV